MYPDLAPATDSPGSGRSCPLGRGDPGSNPSLLCAVTPGPLLAPCSAEDLALPPGAWLPRRLAELGNHWALLIPASSAPPCILKTPEAPRVMDTVYRVPLWGWCRRLQSLCLQTCLKTKHSFYPHMSIPAAATGPHSTSPSGDTHLLPPHPHRPSPSPSSTQCCPHGPSPRPTALLA